jgi:hypothetical protein
MVPSHPASGLTCKFFPSEKNIQLNEPTTSHASTSYVSDLHLMTALCIAPLLSSCQAFTSIPTDNTRPGAPLVTACAHGRSGMVETNCQVPKCFACWSCPDVARFNCRFVEWTSESGSRTEVFISILHIVVVAGSDRRGLLRKHFLCIDTDSICAT